MSRKKSKSKNLMSLKSPLDEVEFILQKQIDKGNELLEIPLPTSASLKAAEKLYNHWNSENFDILKKVFLYSDIARDYSTSHWSIGSIFISDLNLGEKVEKLHSNIRFRISRLDSILSGVRLLADERQTSAVSDKIFFVHGTDCDASARVISFLHELGLQTIKMKELAHAGKTIIAEIQKRSEVGYAVCLLTPDNLGGTSVDALHFRADQNVILQLGIFVGILGRENVSSLYVEGVELPEDYHGFEHIEIDRTNKWKSILLEELNRAGVVK